ncbi:MAG: hypothetical protein L0Y44_07370 [Phycisphaerales bacterium]|nr:hypothetical protein [Phycisphaerales bacterium]
MSRRKFIQAGSESCAVAAVGGVLFGATLQSFGSKAQPQDDSADPVREAVIGNRAKKGAALDEGLVHEFVYYAHSDLDRVKGLVSKNPAVVNATMDWGAGDWESGLGAAAHMGRRDIALFLLEHNARMDVFAAAMLGKLEIVSAAVEAYPSTINVRGPHGIPLIAHAKAGGTEAKAVLEYLESRLKQP